MILRCNVVHRDKISANIFHTLCWYPVSSTSLDLFDKRSSEMLQEFGNLFYHELSFVRLPCVYSWPFANHFWWKNINSCVYIEHSYVGIHVFDIFNRSRSVHADCTPIQTSCTSKRKKNRYLDCFNVGAKFLSIGRNTYIRTWPENRPSDIRYSIYDIFFSYIFYLHINIFYFENERTRNFSTTKSIPQSCLTRGIFENDYDCCFRSISNSRSGMYSCYG